MSLPFDDEVHELKLGNSFDAKPKVGFHTIRYDFKPASVDTTKEACVEVGSRNQVTVTVPHVEGSGLPHTLFKGNKQNLMKECILIINHDTGTVTLEKLASKVTLKKTRFEGSSKAMQHLNGGRVTPVDSRRTTSSKAKGKAKVSPEKEKEKEKEVSVATSNEALKDDSKKIAEMSDSLSSSSDDEDMEDVRPSASAASQPQPPPPPPPPPQKAAPKFRPSSSSSSSHMRNYGVLDNDLALSESSSDDSD